MVPLKRKGQVCGERGKTKYAALRGECGNGR